MTLHPRIRAIASKPDMSPCRRSRPAPVSRLDECAIWNEPGLIGPAESDEHFRLYQEETVERVMTIERLTNDLGVNLAGVEVILNMREQIIALRSDGWTPDRITTRPRVSRPILELNEQTLGRRCQQQSFSVDNGETRERARSPMPLPAHSGMVVRANGGSNAGHTISTPQGVFKMHLVPSGILSPGTTCVIGAGVVIDPIQLAKELGDLRDRGIDTSSLVISDRAHVVLPFHSEIDRGEENLRGEAPIGTTLRGIGPAYADKVSRRGMRMADLCDERNDSG